MEKLYKELPQCSLTRGDRERIMERVRMEAAHKQARRERRFEWSLYTVVLILLAGAVAAVRHFYHDIRLPAVEIPDLSVLHISPMLILVAGCAILLLIFDSLLRKKFHH